MARPPQPRTYGLLVGDVRDGQIDPSGATPRYEIWVVAGGLNYRVAVNVISQDDSEVLAYFDPAFIAPASFAKFDFRQLAAGPSGFTALPVGDDGRGLDYVRDQLFPLGKMTLIPPEGGGVTLKNLLDAQIERAKADSDAVAMVFGQYYQDPGADQSFGFAPERGVHDVHMMQGDTGAHAGENRSNGDGAVFLVFKGGETAALFVRFQTQVVEAPPEAQAIAGAAPP